jgi:KGK domain
MNKNEYIQISEFDVICFSGDEPLSLPKTVRFVEFKERLEERVFHYQSDKPLMDEGIECELLQPGSQGWQKGKVKVCIEFIPDKLNNSSELDVLRSRTIEQEVLD